MAGLMLEEAREMVLKAKREYMRDYRKRNPEKVKAAEQRYWIKKAMQMKEGANREEKEA